MTDPIEAAALMGNTKLGELYPGHSLGVEPFKEIWQAMYAAYHAAQPSDYVELKATVLATQAAPDPLDGWDWGILDEMLDAVVALEARLDYYDVYGKSQFERANEEEQRAEAAEAEATKMFENFKRMTAYRDKLQDSVNGMGIIATAERDRLQARVVELKDALRQIANFAGQCARYEELARAALEKDDD